LIQVPVVSADDVVNSWAKKLIQEGKASGIVPPENGFVPDTVTAIKIAVSIWGPIYGKEHFLTRKPYNAILVDGYWVVSGILEHDLVGSVVYAIIEKKSGEIINISHSR